MPVWQGDSRPGSLTKQKARVETRAFLKIGWTKTVQPAFV